MKRTFVMLMLALQVLSIAIIPLAQTPRRTVVSRAAMEEEQGNLSALHYARRSRPAEADDHEHDEHGNEGTTPVETGGDLSGWRNGLSSRAAAPRWNSPAGRAAAADQLIIDLSEEPGVDPADNFSLAQAALADKLTGLAQKSIDLCTQPKLTLASSDCCTYTINDQLNNRDVVYRQPYHVFKDGTNAQREQDARDFADSVRASMPMFLPYKNSHVYPSQGWFYGNGNFHGAIDFSRDNAQDGVDAAFGVYSAASGRVVSVLWNNLLGNTVVIEHTAPNGDRYRTSYMHLRDGFDHDLQMARAMPSGEKFDENGKVKRQYKYYLFAHKANPNPLYWGTNSQTIQVEVGDTVAAGEFIGWSGNTGSGGAGNGLDDDGNPTNTATANNHLHLMTTVPDPRPSKPNDWVQIDPYGVYAQAGTGCYDVLEDAAYIRLFAPFHSSFHNVPLAVVSKYFGYYPGMGMALQTLSLHRDGGSVLASGSFQSGLPSQWYARFYMNGSDFQYWFDEYHSRGYRPREISVTPDSNGNPRFNVIWKKRAGEAYSTYFGLTDSQWQQKWNEHVVNGGMIVDEHFAYDTNGGARHAAVFINSPKPPFYEYHYLSSLTFNTIFSALNATGYRQTNMSVAEIDGGRTYGGIWRKIPGAWITKYGLTPAEYQAEFNNYSAQGYRLYRIQGYADSSRFAAIWTK
ncbi:MAG: hypothetical protein SF339_13385 [Blastocatellia bacterium]|nr:hypothetical protein [Blastocatellia bacterium]